jgi:carbon storage regulator
MLVLSRRRGERLVIGEVEVIIVQVSGETVRVGITAPREVPIVRGELVRKEITSSSLTPIIPDSRIGDVTNADQLTQRTE